MGLIQQIKECVFIIAEIGCNHNGDYHLAEALVEAASHAGADAAKFQTFRPEEMITRTSPKAEYQIRATGLAESQFARLQRMALGFEQHVQLKELCQQKGVVFCSSAFDETSLQWLVELEVPFFKVPSGEITNLPLLTSMGKCKKPVILSTGMADLDEIDKALKALGHDDVVLLHCVSDYPARWEDANLKAIKTLADKFGLPVGFSDHTEGIEIPLVAVGLGARVIEKHITLDRNMEGGDHKASLEPAEFKEMVTKIRRVEKALGDGVKRCMPAEKNVRDVARKSIVANRDINIGEVITRKSVTMKRPGNGIQPLFLSLIVGSRVTRTIQADERLEWSDVELKE